MTVKLSVRHGRVFLNKKELEMPFVIWKAVLSPDKEHIVVLYDYSNLPKSKSNVWIYKVDGSLEWDLTGMTPPLISSENAFVSLTRKRDGKILLQDWSEAVYELDLENKTVVPLGRYRR